MGQSTLKMNYLTSLLHIISNSQIHYKSEINMCCLLTVTFTYAVRLNRSHLFILLTVFAELRMAQQELEKLVNSGLAFIMGAIFTIN